MWLLLLPNAFKTGIRSLRKRLGYSLVNYICLALGVLTVTLAALYLDYELSYDQQIPNHEQKYRVGQTYRSQGYSVLAFPDYFGTEAAAQQDQRVAIEAIPGVEQAAEFFVFEEPAFVRIGAQRFPTENILQTNSPEQFTDFFGWNFLLGSAELFSNEPFTALLTEAEAEKLYGTDWTQDELLGQLLRIDTVDYTIAGVIANVTANTHFAFNLALHQPRITYWSSRMYVELSPGVDPSKVNQAMNDNIGSINSSLAADELFGGVILQPIASIHLESDLLYEMKPPGDVRYLYIIGIIAIVILLLTIGNYTNLAIAMNFGRQREIGMRKTFGASRGQIAGQFVLEAMLLCLLALPLVGLLLWVGLPYFNSLMGTSIASERLLSPKLWGYLLATSLFIGLLASMYPAIWLSKREVLSLFRPVAAATAKGRLSSRKLIVGLQFILLIGLTSLTYFVNQQLKFLQEQDVGYVKNGVLYVSTNADSSRFQSFKNQLLELPNVTGVGADGFMGTSSYNQTTYKLAGQADVFDDAHQVYMGYDAASILGIKTSVPEWLEDPVNAPRRATIINETLAERFATRYGISKEQLIGQSIILEPEYTNEDSGQVGFPITVAGTFSDINMFSLRQKVDPMVMTLFRAPRYVYWTSIGFSGISPADIRSQVREVFQKQNSETPFIHAFLQDNLTELYAAEERIARLSIFFSLVAFFVALIGLIALTAFLTTLRRKEIGVRKILGASHLEILYRFNWEYIPLVGLALLIAAPLTYYGLQRWLAGFAYRIDLQLWVFLGTALLTLVITLIAVSIVSLRAANSIPIKALRDDQ